jgi:hypothetical protein
MPLVIDPEANHCVPRRGCPAGQSAVNQTVDGSANQMAAPAIDLSSRWHDADSPASAMSPAVGQRIGAFEITGSPGAGGMGEVYRVQVGLIADARTGRQVSTSCHLTATHQQRAAGV